MIGAGRWKGPGLVWMDRLAGWATGCIAAGDDLLFPWDCAICSANAQGALCLDCRTELLEARGLTCPRCAMPVGPHARLDRGCSDCRGRVLGFDQAMALGPYTGPIRDLCLQLKRQENAWIAQDLVKLFVEVHQERLRQMSPAAIVPVPLYWLRRLTRGYNQADELATALGHCLGVGVHRGLRRSINTPKLAGLGRLERRERLKEAFRIQSRPEWAGRTVLLVDDILTTGATTGSAARTLKRAGAKQVVVAVVGRAEGRS